MASTATAPQRKVISGHGRFDEKNLATTDRRKKLPTFNLPSGVTLTFYAPDGAALDQTVANQVELGKGVAPADIEIKQLDGSKTLTVPTPYPFVFSGEAPVVDYTVKPPDGLTVKGGAYTVSQASALRTVVAELVKHGFTDLHYACCGAGYSDNSEFDKLFPGRGYYVKLKWQPIKERI